MRILVTGGAGFIGSHVVDAFVDAGHEVWVLDDLSRGKREQVNPGANFVRMDIKSPEVSPFISERKFDCVSHHAAQIDVRVSVADPMRDATVNIVGMLNLMEAIRQHHVPMVIFASTGGAIYGEQWQYPASELHPTQPLSPYGVAKLSTEYYLHYYAQVHGLRPMVLRYANVYGPRQDPEGEAGVVAILSGRILHGQRLIIYGDGEQTRDYVHVKDVAHANLLALEHLAQQARQSGNNASCLNNPMKSIDSMAQSRNQRSRNVFNVGTGVETSVNALAAMLLEAADADCPVVHLPSRAGEQRRSAIDPSRAGHVLQWAPTRSLPDGLKETFAWFRGQVEATASASRVREQNSSMVR